MTSVEEVTPTKDITTTTEKKNNRLKKPKLADFGAPPAVKSVYFHFCNTHRADVTQKLKEEAVKNGGKFSIEAVGKTLGQMWKAITEEEKTKITDEFNKLKTDRGPATEEWKNSEGYKKFLQSKAEYSKKAGTKKAKAKLLEEGCPKKPLNTYMIYNVQTRQEVKKEWEAAGKTANNKEYAAEVARRWKLLAPEEKAKFVEQSNKQLAEYKEKMIEYQKTDSYQAYEKEVGKLNDKVKASKKVVKTGAKNEEEGGEEGEEKKTRKRPTKETVDAEGNPIVKPKRAKKEPELDADGNVIEKPKRGKKEPELDADGNVIEKKKRARSPKAPALDADGNPIKKERKPRTKKSATEPVAAPDAAATEKTPVAAEEGGKLEAGDEGEEEEAQEE